MNKIISIFKKARKKLRLARYPALQTYEYVHFIAVPLPCHRRAGLTCHLLLSARRLGATSSPSARPRAAAERRSSSSSSPLMGPRAPRRLGVPGSRAPRVAQAASSAPAASSACRPGRDLCAPSLASSTPSACAPPPAARRMMLLLARVLAAAACGKKGSSQRVATDRGPDGARSSWLGWRTELAAQALPATVELVAPSMATCCCSGVLLLLMAPSRRAAAAARHGR
jgi:hypothetical protein